MKDATETQRRILDEAVREILAKGYKRADIKSIAKKAGVTKGGLYYHFKSKSELASGVLDLLASKILTLQPTDFMGKPDLYFHSKLHSLQNAEGQRDIEVALLILKLSCDIPEEEKKLHSKIHHLMTEVVDTLAAAMDSTSKRKQSATDSQIDSVDMALLFCAATMGSAALSEIVPNRSPVIAVHRALANLVKKVL